jgi:8-oxo-dGTP diphosphatase
MITVLCGIIVNEDGKVFIARRAAHKAMAGQWEFPGGKREEGEKEENCLGRELMEELGMRVRIVKRLGEHTHAYENFTIHLIAWQCSYVSASYYLSDHDRYAWVKPEELSEYPMTEADLPFVALCRDFPVLSRSAKTRRFLRQFFTFFLPLLALDLSMLQFAASHPAGAFLFSIPTLSAWSFSTFIFGYLNFYRPWRAVHGYFWGSMAALLTYLILIALYFST